MSPYRALAILIALCIFGAIQAAFVGQHDQSVKHRLHQDNLNSLNSHGKWNASRPPVNGTRPHGNYSHPIYFRPIRSPRFHKHNSSNVDSWNSSYFPGGNFNGQWNGHRPHHGRWNTTGNFSSTFPQGERAVPAVIRNNLNSAPQQRGFFDRKPSYGNYNASVYKPAVVYRPEYRPAYRPIANATWQRPSNNSWGYYN